MNRIARARDVLWLVRMTTFAKVTGRLQRKLGAKVVRTDDAACTAASYDSSKLPFLPEAVIFPRKEADIAVALALANEHRVPVTVRGRGTTLTGAAAPRQGGWVIDMLGWNKITVDAEAGMAHVQAGAKVADIQRATEAVGWFYPPDPSSREYCTIGGNIACNAGGMHGGKYGVTRDFILALEGFLPTGEFVKWGTPTKKFSSGFNLRDLWIGSEGMLGLVTAATLKLIPSPAARWTLLAAFKTEPEAFRAVRALFRLGRQPGLSSEPVTRGRFRWRALEPLPGWLRLAEVAPRRPGPDRRVPWPWPARWSRSWGRKRSKHRPARTSSRVVGRRGWTTPRCSEPRQRRPIVGSRQ